MQSLYVALSCVNCCSVGLYACFRPENVAIESRSLRYPHSHLDAVKTTLTVSLLLTSFYSTCFCTFFFATLNFNYAQVCTYERLSASFVAFIESKSKFAHVRVVWRSFFVLFAQNFSHTNGLRHFRRVSTGSTCGKDMVSWFLCPENELVSECGHQASAMSCVSTCAERVRRSLCLMSARAEVFI